MLIEPENSTVAIALRGNLNPKIFTPDWFARCNLLSAKEADSAEIEIVHRQIAKFRAGWFNLSVESNLFVASTKEHPIQLRDLVVRTFQEYLSHTPIGMLGINREVHFSVGSIEQRDRIGYKLAPPEAWGEWAPDILVTEGKSRGGMQTLVMQQSVVDDRQHGYIQATVQPSTLIKNSAGVFVMVNDHYQVGNPENVSGCEEMIGYLGSNFDDSQRRSEWIIDRVMELKDC